MDDQALEEIRRNLLQAWQNFRKKSTRQQRRAVKRILKRQARARLQDLLRGEFKPTELSFAAALLVESLQSRIIRLLKRLFRREDVCSRLRRELEDKQYVLDDGDIIGFGKYEMLDTGWAEALVSWLENYCEEARFPTPATQVSMDNQASLALFGDWGGGTWSGNEVAKTVSKLIAEQGPDYSIHLGDVYYAGDKKEERKFLLDLWPAAKVANFTLNSNHEMYPLGRGYFKTALADPLFRAQDGKSFFALENDHWIVVGLDSAFDADKDDLYMTGRLNAQQRIWLGEIAARGKGVIALSHHNPLDTRGRKKEALWHDVADALQDSLKYWYFGHTHAGAVYKPFDGVNCRLVGHGLMPWGKAKTLKESPQVEWYEHQYPQPRDGLRVQNGFLLLKLDKENVYEAFFGEDGQMHWRSANWPSTESQRVAEVEAEPV